MEVPTSVRELAVYFPRYLAEFGSMFVGPKRFLAKQDLKAQAAFSDSLAFLGLSVLLMVLVQSPLLEPDVPFWRHLAANAVVNLVAVVLVAIALRTAWRLVGARATVREFLVMYGRVFGVAGVVFTVFLLLGEGVIKAFDPEIYAEGRAALRGEGELPDLLSSAAWWAGSAVQFIGVLLIVVWLLVAWGAYRALTGLTVGRSVLAYFLFGIINIPLAGILFLIGRAVS